METDISDKKVKKKYKSDQILTYPSKNPPKEPEGIQKPATDVAFLASHDKHNGRKRRHGGEKKLQRL
ncbi:hypothetical protein NECAME_10921 [Necator americanus]|uniref:Uncharacterized protein n=1 Tax=Necator americanus TaxID=51031 RepID=W2T9F1_NECAM|nr:hypothetical protein NECAME_10921 [Necator americanus]ETN77617.1 hypothetical protein NECAME_10921 [Necator americanus]